MTNSMTVLFAMAIISFLVGCYLCEIIVSRYWERKTVEKGFAQYNPVTGEWEWKDEGKG